MREISNPLGVIDDLFTACTKGDVLNPPREWGEKTHFIKALQLEDEENFSKVPCLNNVELVEQLPPFSLVRYRCMVQDIFDPEMYAAFCLRKTANGDTQLVNLKYRDRLPEGELEDVGNSALSMRGAYYCVPLPGETAWATDSAQPALATHQPTMASGVKRRRPDEDVDMGDMDMGLGAGSAPANAPERPENLEAACSRPKHSPAKGPEVGQNADTFGLNLPLPEEKRSPCIVKLYDADEEALKVCEAVEVLGILCVDPQMANLGESVWALGVDARDPSTALVPRLHGLVVRKLPCYHPMFPFTPSFLSEERLSCAFQGRLAAPGALAAARQAALSLLLQSLGDQVAAEYVLALLVSRVSGSGDALGPWSLNLTQLDTLQVAALVQAIQELVPRAVCLPMTTESLNAGRWYPKKDFNANRLVSGKLQLAGGTILVLDETQLSEGSLNEEGVRAFHAIQGVVSKQALLCDFAVCTMEVPLELNCIVASKGASVLKAATVTLPLDSNTCTKGMDSIPDSLPNSETASGLDAARFLLGLISRQTRQVRIPENVAEVLSSDYAEVRNALQEVGQATLCSWVSLARSLCLSHGEDELSLSRWRSIFDLEKQRLQRCVAAGLMHPR